MNSRDTYTKDNFNYAAKQLGFITGLSVLLFFFFNYANLGYEFDWTVLYVINPTYEEVFGHWLLRGLLITLNISVVSAFFALLIGTLVGIARLSSFKPLYLLSTCYVELFRNTPLLIQLFFWYFAFPMILPEAVNEFLNAHNFEFTASVIGLSTYTGAYMAEVIRAGIQAIPKGHTEAGTSSGLTYFQMLRHIILPQAFRIIIPPLGSEFLNNMKNSSLAMTIGVAELCWQSQQIESYTFRGFEATTAATIIYLSTSIGISLIMNSVNHHLQIGPAKKLNMFDRFLEFLFFPVALIYKVLKNISQFVAGFFPERQTQIETEDLQISSHQFLSKQIAKYSVLALKALFLVAVAALLFFTVKGILSLKWSVITSNLPKFLIWNFPTSDSSEVLFGLGGLSISFILASISIFFSFFIGLAVGLGRLSKNPLINTPSILYIELIRGNPLIMVIFWVYFFSPIITGMQINVLWSATIAFILFSGAYLGEIVRAGVLAIPPGQTEAARASGLTYFQTMRHIVLPQALKIMIPAIVGQFITIFKDTSLAYIIGVFELTTVAQTISNRLMVHPFEVYLTIGFMYFVCCYSMSLFAKRLEKKYTPA